MCKNMDKYLTNSYLCAILLRWGTMIELVLEETTVWRGIRDGMAAQANCVGVFLHADVERSGA